MRVYISSPFLDLKGCRAKAYDALRRIGVDAIGMEDYVATDERPVDKCLGDVRSCDAYVGLLAWRYGYVPDDAQCSVTELEYQTAVRERIPQLLFLLHPDAPWPRTSVDRDPARIDALRGEWEKNRIVSHFQTCDELGALVTAAVARRLLEERERGDAHGAADAEEERRALQLQLDEIKRQLQFLAAHIAADRPGALPSSAPAELPQAALAPAPAPPAPPHGARGPRSAPPQSTRSASTRAPRMWTAGGTVLALAATLLVAVRWGPLGQAGPRTDDPSSIVAAPPATDSASLPSTAADSAPPDSLIAGDVLGRHWISPAWTAALVALLLAGAGLVALRRSRRNATSSRARDVASSDDPPVTRISNRPAPRSTAPPLTELSSRNRRFLDETQQQVERRLQALGDSPAR